MAKKPEQTSEKKPAKRSAVISTDFGKTIKTRGAFSKKTPGAITTRDVLDMKKKKGAGK